MRRRRLGDAFDAFGELLAKLETGLENAVRKEARGFVVVVIDTYPPESVVSAYGVFATPEAALIQAGEFDASPHTGTNPVDGEDPWKHVVVPLYPPVGKDGAK